VRTSRLALAGSLAAALLVGACASAPSEIVFDLSDPRGDVRLEHPPLAPIGPGTFDLERVVLSRVGDAWLLEATFAEPVREVQGAWVGRDFQAPMLPQTIDVYLDVTPGVGHVETLEGRGVRISPC
jgi:hypothetical protein